MGATLHRPDQEWRRLFCEMFGTFLLVTVGAAVIDAKTHGGIGRVAGVAAWG